jgi:hypothetical protein
MGFKVGLLVGFGAGYVLGAKAGRERYEELKSSWDQFIGSPPVQRTVDRSREAVEEGAQRGIRAVQEGVDRAGSTGRGRVEGQSGTS